MNCSGMSRVSIVGLIGLGMLVEIGGCEKSDSDKAPSGTAVEKGASTHPVGTGSSVANLKLIAATIPLYANEHRGERPPDLGALAATQDIGMEVFLLPGHTASLPANSATMDPDERAAWVNAHTDYDYVCAGKGSNLVQDPAPLALVAEKEAKNGQINVLLENGRVESMSEAQFKLVIERNNKEYYTRPAVK